MRLRLFRYSRFWMKRYIFKGEKIFMIKLLIYGIGETYQKLRRIIKWENVQLLAFVDSYKFRDKTWEGGVK